MSSTDIGRFGDVAAIVEPGKALASLSLSAAPCPPAAGHELLEPNL
jgi:hypothetical protein